MASRQSGKLSTSTPSPNNAGDPGGPNGPGEWGFASAGQRLQDLWNWFAGFMRRNWIGTTLMLLATIVFFWPMVIRLDSYSPGGDAMFNAWILQRNQNCVMRDNCPNYLDANIYYPNKDTMLYSEEQFSPGLLTMPLRLVTDNPLTIYNLYTIACFFFTAWFMYLLAKRLSKGNEYVSVLAGLIFAFAPFKMAAVFHMQNLSILFLPLAVLFVLKFFDARHRRYLVGLLTSLVLLFYASWYQMVFALAVFALIIIGVWVFRLADRRAIIPVAVTVGLAALITMPLALQYVRFSKDTGATFPLSEQLLYQSSLSDYVRPHDGTILGKFFYKAMPEGAHRNAWNLDSYSYHGLVLYAIAIAMIIIAFRRRKTTVREDKRIYAWVAILAAIGLLGFILSLGPLLKVNGTYEYFSLPGGGHVTIPMPYLLIDKFLPQLAFIRAVGRWSVLTLFALCCLLALLPYFLEKVNWTRTRKRLIYVLVGVAAIVELAPAGMVAMADFKYSYNLAVPGVYKYIKEHKEVDNIVIIHGDSGYPGEKIPVARAEWVLWAGYHNKNIFNGYSGYEPKNYLSDYIEFKDLDQGDIKKMQRYGLRYVVIDKQLSATRWNLVTRSRAFFPEKLYEDRRYILFKLPQ
jgi:hypothetical protein